MIPSSNKPAVMDVYPSNSPTEYTQQPVGDASVNGVAPLDTLPVQWWNWLWKNITSNEAKTASVLNNIYDEIINVLSEAELSPDNTSTQLLRALNKLYDVIATTSKEGYVKSSNTVGKVSVDSTGIMTPNGLGDPSSLSTTSKVVVTAINEVKSSIGTLSSLTTTAKDNIVNALNELVTDIGALGSAASATVGSTAGNVPLIGTSLGSTDNNILVTDTNGKLKPSGVVVGNAAGKTAGKASGNVPLIGSIALGTTQDTIIVNDGAGTLKDSGLKVGTGANNIPQIGTALGTTNNNIVVTDANGKLKPSGTVIGSAAGKTAGNGNGNVPLNGASLGSTNYNAVCTDASGALKTYDKTLPQVASYGYYCSETPTITNNIATYALTNLTGLTVATGIVLRICFSKSLESSATIDRVKLTFGGVTAVLKAPRGDVSNGLTNLKSHKFTGGTYTSTSPYRVFDPFTCFELIYNGTDWVIMNNPVTCSHSSLTLSGKNYRVYADGYIEQWGRRALSSGSGVAETFAVEYIQNPVITATIHPSSLDASERNMFQVYSISTAGFNVYGNYIASSCNAEWCSHGY